MSSRPREVTYKSLQNLFVLMVKILIKELLLILMSDFKIFCSSEYDLDVDSIIALKWNILLK